MKKLILICLPLLLLTACPSQKEVTVLMDELSAERTAAIKVIDKGSWDLDSLLIAHDYFFSFSERVHLLKEEVDAVKNMQKYIKGKGAKSFCESFVMPTLTWQKLEAHCAGGEFYKCSPEIQTYASTRLKMLELLGADSAKTLNNETTCK